MRLSPECRQLLGVGALIGRSFHLMVLAGAAGISGEPLLDLLDQAREAGFLERKPGTGRFRFIHPLVRQTLADDLTEAARLRTHAHIAETLEAFAQSNPDSYLADLAYHLARAAPLGYGARAVDAARRAAVAALAAFGYEEAVRHLEQALMLLPHADLPPDERRIMAATLNEQIGDALDLAAHRADAVVHDNRAEELLAHQDGLATVRLARKTGSVWLDDQQPARAFASLASAEAALADTEAAVPAADAACERMELLLLRMDALYYMADTEQLASLTVGAEPLVMREGTDRQQVAFSDRRVALALRAERYRVSPDTIAAAREHRRLARRLDDPLADRAAAFRLGFALLWGGEPAEGEWYLSECADLALAAHDRTRWVHAQTYLAVAHRMRVDLDATRALSNELRESATTTHLPGYDAAARANLAWVASREGRLSVAETLAREALDLWNAPSAYPFEWLARGPLFAALAATGDTDGAVEQAVGMLELVQQALPEDVVAALRASVSAASAADSDEVHLAINKVLAVTPPWIA